LKHIDESVDSNRLASPPARGRGLKQVASLKGTARIKSPPARGRGLKPVDRYYQC